MRVLLLSRYDSLGGASSRVRFLHYLDYFLASAWRSRSPRFFRCLFGGALHRAWMFA